MFFSFPSISLHTLLRTTQETRTRQTQNLLLFCLCSLIMMKLGCYINEATHSLWRNSDKLTISLRALKNEPFQWKLLWICFLILIFEICWLMWSPSFQVEIIFYLLYCHNHDLTRINVIIIIIIIISLPVTTHIHYSHSKDLVSVSWR